MSSFICNICSDRFDSPNHLIGCPAGIYIYRAKNGVEVSSVCVPEDDFKTVFHYMRFSYGAWAAKIFKAVKQDWAEKLQSVGIMKHS